MRTRRLGSSDIEVSVVGLGCNNFGRRTDEDASRAVIDAALDAGITFFDTADVYGDGQSEAIIGRALDGRRDRVVLATKFGGGGPQSHGQGSSEYIRRALDASLERLRTDWIDLYQHHQEDPETPLGETIAALDELVHEGRIRAYGTSNYSPATLEEAASLAQEAYVSEQSEYSLLRRGAERELIPTCERLGLSFIPYFPLASGLLTGKVGRDRPPEPGTRLHGKSAMTTSTRSSAFPPSPPSSASRCCTSRSARSSLGPPSCRSSPAPRSPSRCAPTRRPARGSPPGRTSRRS